MANRLGSLVVSLGLDASEYIRGLTKSEYDAQKFARNVENAIESARSALLGMGAAATGAALAVAGVANSIAEYQGLSEQIGDTAVALASLQPAASSSGTSLDEVARASVKLTTALSNAKDGTDDAVRAVKALGIDYEALRRQSPVDQLETVAKAMSGLESSSTKTALSVALFGKSGSELIGFLNDLGDGSERFTRLTQEQIQAADDFSKGLDSLKGEVQALTQATVAGAVPGMNDLVQMLREVVRYVGESETAMLLFRGAVTVVRAVVETLVIVGSEVAFTFKAIGTEIGGISAQIAALARGDFTGFTAISDMMREDAARARRELDTFQREVLNPTRFNPDDQSAAEARRLGLIPPTRAPIDFRLAGSDKSTKPKATDQRSEVSDLDRYIQKLQEARNSAQDLTEVQRAEREISRASAQGFSEEKRRYILALADEADQTRDLAEMKKLELEAKREIQRQEEQRTQRIDALRANTDIGRQKAELDDLLLAYQAYTEGRITSELEYQQVVQGILDRNKKDVAQVKSFGEEMGLSFTSAFEQAILEGKKFSDVLQGIAKDVLAIVIRRQVTEPLGKAATGFFDGLFKSFEGGGYTGAGARSGGMDGRGGYLAMVHPNETILDHTRGGAGGGVSIFQTFDFRGAAPEAVAMLRAEAARIKQETIAAVLATADRGGSAAARLGRA